MKKRNPSRKVQEAEENCPVQHASFCTRSSRSRAITSNDTAPLPALSWQPIAFKLALCTPGALFHRF